MGVHVQNRHEKLILFPK